MSSFKIATTSWHGNVEHLGVIQFLQGLKLTDNRLDDQG
jgi:hypothetical protein